MYISKLRYGGILIWLIYAKCKLCAKMKLYILALHVCPNHTETMKSVYKNTKPNLKPNTVTTLILCVAYLPP